MSLIDEKFEKLGVDNAPGQEKREEGNDLPLIGEKIEGEYVDFSHGDVDAHEPIPTSLDTFVEGFKMGGAQAYTEYKGKNTIREDLAVKLSKFTDTEVEANNIIITPGTQGALFLAMGSLVARGDKVAIVEPDYFANRKLVEFFEGEIIPIELDYFGEEDKDKAGLNFENLEEAFKSGVKLFLFSNPNNPTGVVYSDEEITKIAELAKNYDVTVVADELYSRQIFDEKPYVHFKSKNVNQDKVITIIGPSKTESLSGFRLGVAFGSQSIIRRMEKLQAIVSLRAAGYCQAVIKDWFNEPQGWMDKRIEEHKKIRDELIEIFRQVEGVRIRKTEAGSYIFPKLPPLKVSLSEFVRIIKVQANVIVTNGTEFGPQFTDSIRLNFSQDRQKSKDAARRICKLIERYRK